MYLWVTLGLAAVVAMKYYTSRRAAAFKRRIQKAQNGLIEAKKRHKTARDKREAMGAMEDLQKRRMKYTRDLIADMRVRLSEADKTPPQAEKQKAGRPLSLPASGRELGG